MLLSKSCEYGIRAALYVADVGEARYVPIREISERLDISFHFLTKILQTLTQAGLMKSFKGPNGGVALTRPANQIVLEDIVSAIDGRGLFEECVLGLPGCGSRQPCPLHHRWTSVRGGIHQMFREITLAQFREQFDGVPVNMLLSP